MRYKESSDRREQMKIEEQIRKHYCVENGEWLIEKGKIKEAKLLKEACLELERRAREIQRDTAHYYGSKQDLKNREAALESRETKLKVTEEKLALRLKYIKELIASFENR
jgi:SMC interacting uncharacterized protein involved in chromosome segregation